MWMPSRFIFAAVALADAVEFSDRQGLDEGGPHLRGDHEHAVRFALVGGELRQEFVVGDARWGGEARVSSYLGPDLLRDLRCEGDAVGGASVTSK